MGDLIDRQAAIDGVIKSCFGQACVVQAEAAAIQYIKRIPSEQPDRKTGHWIGREHCQVDEDGYDIGTCSVCGEEITIDPLHDNFCPHCGAEMSHDD